MRGFRLSVRVSLENYIRKLLSNVSNVSLVFLEALMTIDVTSTHLERIYFFNYSSFRYHSGIPGFSLLSALSVSYL